MHPPKLFLRFLRWFCDPELLTYIEGDLIELYSERLKTGGKRHADLKYVIDVLLLFRPGVIKQLNNESTNFINMDMLANYLKVGFRNILKYKVYSSINAFGFATGIASSMLIMLFIADEWSFDRFHQDADKIFRIGSEGSFEGSAFESAVCSPPVAAALRSEVPEIEDAIRFGWWRSQPMRYGEKSFIEKRILVADSNFFQFFSFQLISGDVKTALQGTNKVVITQSTARRYFGTEDPLGKILLRSGANVATEVTGVVKDPPSNSHIQFDMMLSSQSWQMMAVDAWSNTFIYTYIKTNSPDVVQKKLEAMAESHLGPELERIIGISMTQFKANGNRFGFFLQPMLDIHLKSTLSSELTPPGSMQYVYVFGAIALFILLIACINFMNLSTARSAMRAKEVGIRKSIGAMRAKLIGQFLSESLIFSFASTLIALAVIGMVLNPFNSLSGKSIEIGVFMQPAVIGGVVLFALVMGLIAGIYPAFYLTRFKPVDVLKGRAGTGPRNSQLRNVLVTFQFMISIALIVGSLVVGKQLNYMQQMNLGFNSENVVNVANGWTLGKNTEAFKSEIALHPEFKNVSLASALPPNITDSNIFRKGGSEQDIVLHVLTVDYDHLSTMGYAMAEGRFFSRDFPSDSAAILVNEAAYKALGLTQLEGNTIINFNAEKPEPFNLIGVVKDFNYENLRTTIKPMAILLTAGKNVWMVRQSNNEVAIRISTADSFKTLEKLETIWKKYSSGPFEFTFVDDNVEAMFRSEARMARIVSIFTVLIIVVACLGLFGLATYLAEQRSKEISIRKVLGASVPQVIIMLLRNFLVLITIAFVVAAPTGWLIMRNWLEEFAYRTTIDLWMILLAGASAVVIAMLTIGWQSLKAARENPIKNLKSE